jgi:hypothetical protein
LVTICRIISIATATPARLSQTFGERPPNAATDQHIKLFFHGPTDYVGDFFRVISCQ